MLVLPYTLIVKRCALDGWPGWLYTLLGRAFPIGTFVVNIVGAFCIGLVMEFSLPHWLNVSMPSRDATHLT